MKQVIRSRGYCGSSMRAVGLLLMMFPAAGCTTMGAPYAPETSYTARSDIEALKAEFASATSIKKYFELEPETEQARNKFIAGRLVLYDLAYVDWVSRFRFGRAAESTVLDTATLGVNIATTLFGGVRTKEILGAIAGAITGSRTSYEKNFFDEQSAYALAAQMNAERKAALIPILEGTSASIKDYPLTRALADLANYQFAGTIDGALSGIHREAGLKEAKANAAIADIEQFRVVAFAPDASSDRIRAWLYPGLARFSEDGDALDAKGNVIRNDAQVNMLLDELERLGLGGLPIATFLTSGSLGSERAKVITRLQIP